MADVERQIDALYALPLDAFTQARNDLAAALRTEGDPESAKLVKALSKPSVAAWVLNRLARTSAKDVKDVLKVGERLRAAEKTALGGGGAAALREAAAEERDAVGVVVRRAEMLARDAGVNVTPALAQKIGDTVRAAMVDEVARDQFVRGRLTTDLQRVGFGEAGPPSRTRGGGGVKTKPRTPREPRDEEAERRERERAEREREQARASAEADRLEKALQRAEREFERLTREAAEAAAAAKESKARVAELRKQLRAAERAGK